MIWKLLSVQNFSVSSTYTWLRLTLIEVSIPSYITFVFLFVCWVSFFLLFESSQRGSFLVHAMETALNSICIRECIHTYTYPRKREHGVWKDKLIVASNERVCEVNNKEQATPQKNSWTSQDVYLILLPFRLSEFYTFLNNSKHNVLGSDNGMVVFIYV